MTSHQQVCELELSQPQSLSMLAVAFVVAAAGFVMFTNSDATARQTNPLSGSGEVLRGSLAAPGAVQTVADPSLPDAAEALRSLGSSRMPAVDAPTF